VHLYSLCWNEADILGFFFRHYDPWVDRYVIYDDGSTDGSLDLLASHPRVEIRRFEREHPDSFVRSQQALQNRVWRESRGRAAWVVVTALDEHLFVPGRSMGEFLNEAAADGVTAIPALGFQMLADEMPPPGELLCATCRFGMPDAAFNKLSLFNPQAIDEINFAPGRHSAAPVGTLRFPARDELLLLHYKFLGFERFVARCQQLRTGLGQADFAAGYGEHYSIQYADLRTFWDIVKSVSIDISSPDLALWPTHPGVRWWRDPAFSLPPRRTHVRDS
jgi:hypothetical protein